MAMLHQLARYLSFGISFLVGVSHLGLLFDCDMEQFVNVEHLACSTSARHRQS